MRGRRRKSVAEGARAGGAEVDIRRVAETAPAEVVKAAGFKTDTAHPEIEGPDALAAYDAIIVGAPTRYGRMPSQMAAFWDTTGGLWISPDAGDHWHCVSRDLPPVAALGWVRV